MEFMIALLILIVKLSSDKGLEIDARQQAGKLLEESGVKIDK